ncbi:histone-lysine N-methyltransferase SETMAR [Plakobranchus ocellatus]|uniref:Histone-lysine N-methyltransferase SETMAR n=1 Tax=Plakobranchus ocellatus TaxID=259542 RepID=A0AAV4CR22_9GAST|nr:histone-lysine N-methyltransferase SETMAR [Plakobranchus ocellatus]
MTWKHPSSPVTKKFKVQRSTATVMATVFLDAKGVILSDILPQDQCINAARYCSTLDRLKEAIRRKRREWQHGGYDLRLKAMNRSSPEGLANLKEALEKRVI